MNDFTPVPTWIIRREDLSHGSKLVWSRIRRYAGEDGKAFPKVETLAREVGVKSGQCRLYLHELVKVGLLEVTYRPGQRNLYTPLQDVEGVQDVERVQDINTTPSGCCRVPLQDVEGASEETIEERTQETTTRKSKYTKPFLQFWDAFPRKKAKKDAFRAWKKATDKPPVTELVEIINRQRKSDQWKKDNGSYIPYPATWLNQGRWDDEIEPDQQPQRPRIVV